MNDVAGESQRDATPVTPDVPVAPKERGWWRVIIAVLLFLFVPMTPVLRILLPVDQTFMLLAPALSACAVAGWWIGGRLPLAAVWIGLAGWVLYTFTTGGSQFAYLMCGWSVLLATAFTSLVIFSTKETARPFSIQAFTAIGLALVFAAGAATVMKQSSSSLPSLIVAEASKRSEESLAEWRQTTSSKEWNDLFAGNADAKTIASTMEAQLQAAPAEAADLFPSLLALESLIALAIAWAVYHRMGRERIGPPLAALRDFRFSDQFVWGLVAGLAMVVLPGFAGLTALGANLLLFFGALYALRGVGVALWFLSPGRVLMAFLIVFAVVFPIVLGVLGVGLGVGDTWLNWRARGEPKT